jgi:hypothetical protein
VGWFGGSASRVKQIEQKIEYLPRWRAELLAKAMMGETAVIRQRGTWYFVGRGRLTGKGRSWREALNDARASDAVGCVLNGKR